MAIEATIEFRTMAIRAIAAMAVDSGSTLAVSKVQQYT
jgi:hypothetical protein